MITLADLRPGDIIFGPINQPLIVRIIVRMGQWLLAGRRARLSYRRWRKINHVLIVTQGGAAPKAVQAMPRGAEEIELTEKHWTSDYVVVRPAYGTPQRLEGLTRLSAADQGFRVARAACSYIGTPYGFLTYAALLAEHVLPGRQERLAAYISSRKEMICSQLADQALCDAGFHVFTDGRLPQDVVPAELFRAILDMPGTQYVMGGLSLAWRPGEWWSNGQK